jgi:hypothetical protein
MVLLPVTITMPRRRRADVVPAACVSRIEPHLSREQLGTIPRSDVSTRAPWVRLAIRWNYCYRSRAVAVFFKQFAIWFALSYYTIASYAQRSKSRKCSKIFPCICELKSGPAVEQWLFFTSESVSCFRIR